MPTYPEYEPQQTRFFKPAELVGERVTFLRFGSVREGEFGKQVEVFVHAADKDGVLTPQADSALRNQIESGFERYKGPFVAGLGLQDSKTGRQYWALTTPPNEADSSPLDEVPF